MSDAEPIDPPPDALGATLAGRSRLGPYALVRELGHGGMASVYEAVHVGLGKRVAVKVMQAHLAAQETGAARFVREARAVAKVKHPNVVDVFDVGEHEGVHYLVMELLEGIDLSEYLKVHGRLSLAETLDLLLPVVSAVAAAHDAGIVHRDLKPANVFLAKDRHGKTRPKVVDFGISTFVEKDGDLELTHTQTMLGTVRYMSPEQTRGAKYADARSDQYSLAVMLYLCTTGRTPYTGEGVYETIHAIRNDALEPPSRHEPSLPPAFDAILSRALSREPAARFPSVAALGRALVPLAVRKSSANWEREFAPEPEDLAVTAPEVDARPPAKPAEDATVMTSVTQSTADESGRRRRVVLVAAGAFAVVAIAGGIAVGARGWSTGAAPPASTASAPPGVSASGAPTASAISSTTASSAPPPTVPTATPPPATTVAAVPSVIATPSDSAARPKPPPIPARPPAATKPTTGNNGAPILE